MNRSQFLHHRALRADACVQNRRARCPDRFRFALATTRAMCIDRQMKAAHQVSA